MLLEWLQTKLKRRSIVLALKILKRADGQPYGFIADAEFKMLCRIIANSPGVTFVPRRHFFCFSSNMHAEFSFQGNQFKIVPDPWDDSFWIIPMNEDATHPEIDQLRSQLELRLMQ